MSFSTAEYREQEILKWKHGELTQKTQCLSSQFQEKKAETMQGKEWKKDINHQIEGDIQVGWMENNYAWTEPSEILRH